MPISDIQTLLTNPAVMNDLELLELRFLCDTFEDFLVICSSITAVFDTMTPHLRWLVFHIGMRQPPTRAVAIDCQWVLPTVEYIDLSCNAKQCVTWPYLNA